MLPLDSNLIDLRFAGGQLVELIENYFEEKAKSRKNEPNKVS